MVDRGKELLDSWIWWTEEKSSETAGYGGQRKRALRQLDMVDRGKELLDSWIWWTEEKSSETAG